MSARSSKRVASTALMVFSITACGGGGGGGGATIAPPPPAPAPPPAPTTNDPVPSSFFIDASSTLPSSRSAGCFDALAVDIDADGDLDLLLAGFAQSGAPNLVYINDGAGLFTDESATKIPTNSFVSEHVVSGDFDMDGDEDVIFANVNNNSAAEHEYYLNTGVGGELVSSAQALPVAGLTAFVAAQDFDNDNDLDLFLANFGVSNLLINDGFGVFVDESSTRLPGNDAQITEDSGIGDVNGDGFIDIFIGYRGSQSEGQGLQNRLWMNDGLGVFTDVTNSAVPALSNSTFDVQLADVDGDMDLDAVFANATIGNSNTPLLDNLLINNGNGVFSDETATRWPQTVLSNTYGVSLMDLDRDGDLDILTAENIGVVGSGQVRAFANDGTGQFIEQTTQLIGDVQGNITDIEAADFNNDGLLDLYFCAASNFGTAESARDFLFLAQ